MKPIEEAVANIQGEVIKVGKKWRVVTPFGRVIEFDEKWLDLEQCWTPLLPGETEFNREETQFETCMFMQEAYGCVDVRRLAFGTRTRISRYAKAYEFTVDDNTFRPFGISEAKVVFGEAATVRNSFFPAGWRITVPDAGFVVLGLSGKELNVRRIEGNLYAEALRFLQLTQGYAVVHGKRHFCTTFVAHGEVMGIRVIPEVPLGVFGFYARSHLALIPVIILGFWVASLFPDLGLRWLIGGGWILSAVLMMFMRGSDRKRGAVLINKFPQVGGRDAKLDEARQRGML